MPDSPLSVRVGSLLAVGCVWTCLWSFPFVAEANPNKIRK